MVNLMIKTAVVVFTVLFVLAIISVALFIPDAWQVLAIVGLMIGGICKVCSIIVNGGSNA